MEIGRKEITLALVLVLTGFLFTVGSPVEGADNANFTVTLTIGNTAPVVYYVQTTNDDPADGTTKTIYIYFNATDADGVLNLNDSSAQVFISYQPNSSLNHTSSSCTAYQTNTTAKSYNCSITINYYDNPGNWSINASVKDINGVPSDKTDINFTMNTLSAIQINITAIDFGTRSLGELDIAAGNNPLRINNTGNDDFTLVNVTGYELRGVDVPDYVIPASNFSVNTTNAPNGTILSNATAVTVNGATLPRGANSFEELYFYIEEVPLNLSEQVYNSTVDWRIDVD